MNIPNSTNRLQPSTEPTSPRTVDLGTQSTPTAEQAGSHVAQQAQAKAETPDPPDHARAPEVEEFVRQLREVSEIRSDVIDAVRKLLSVGHYDSRKAAEATAEKLLGG